MMDLEMFSEISAAVSFLVSCLRSYVEDGVLVGLQTRLQELLAVQYTDHWHPEAPLRGHAYRCINIDGIDVDPIVRKAARLCGIDPELFKSIFHDGLALWIDPLDVSYRFGRGRTVRLIGAETVSSEHYSAVDSSQRYSPLLYEEVIARQLNVTSLSGARPDPNQVSTCARSNNLISCSIDVHPSDSTKARSEQELLIVY